MGVQICDKRKQGARIWGNKSFPSCCKLMPKSDNKKEGAKKR